MENQYEFNTSGIREVLAEGIVDVDLTEYLIDKNVKRDRKGREGITPGLCLSEGFYHRLKAIDKEVKEKVLGYEGNPLYN